MVAPRVHDPIMRSEVASKVSARIGVAPADFQKLLTRPARDLASSGSAAPAEVAVAPQHGVAMLCLLALRDSGARDLLLNEGWSEVLAQTPDAELLRRILGAHLNPDDVASINVFMATLSPGEEALVSSWLLQKLPTNPVAVASGFWSGLQQAAVRRQLRIAEGRMQIPQLSAGEMTSLQKQVVDLKAQLHQLSAFSSARVLDR